MRSDTELVGAAAAGDAQAFGEIVTRYQSLVCAIAYSGTGDHALSEELAQDTFVAAWKGLRELREAAKLKAWLAGIVRNLVKGAHRSRARARTEPLAAAADPRRRPGRRSRASSRTRSRPSSGARSSRSPRRTGSPWSSSIGRSSRWTVWPRRWI